jgi:hypothetical protein
LLGQVGSRSWGGGLFLAGIVDESLGTANWGKASRVVVDRREGRGCCVELTREPLQRLL